ncbi:MAG: hypothetical protein E6R06_26420 [Mycobacterium sp.]|nr:MAG: hypothetical protein E6R06_26420 [Mycobacterium sp.]
MELSDAELDADADAVIEAALNAARLQGARRLLAWFGLDHLTAEQAVAALMRRDPADPHYRLLGVLERQWVLVVARIAERAARPGPAATDSLAVADARDRGVTWAAIAAEFDITSQAAHGRYKAGGARGGRRGPQRSGEPNP